MSRDSNGTHTLPTGNPVVSGSAISSSVHNATLTDLSTEITDSLSRSGKGGMSAALAMGGNKITGLGDGTKTAPAVTFSSDPDTGIYRIGSNNLGVSVGDTKILDVGTAGLDVVGKMAATGVVSGTNGTFSGAVSGTTGTFSSTGSFGGALDMNSNKITELANGSATGDAVNFGQTLTVTAPTITWSTDWADSASGSFVAQAGKVVTFTIFGSATVGTATMASIATLPAGSRPLKAMYFSATLSDGATVYPARVTVADTGVISMGFYDNGTAYTPGFTPSTGDLILASGTFVAA